MGLSDLLLGASVGTCGNCGIRYVVKARILADDSHFQFSELYGCPICETDNPEDIIDENSAGYTKEIRSFARAQLEKRLSHRHNCDGLVCLESNMY